MLIVGEKMSRVDFEGPCTKQQTLICLRLLRSAGQRNMNTRRHPASKRRYTQARNTSTNLLSLVPSAYAAPSLWSLQ